MGMLQRQELLELVYENNVRVISIFFIILYVYLVQHILFPYITRDTEHVQTT